MTTPFSPFANAVLYFRLPVGEAVTDATGNAAQLASELAVKAVIKQAGSNQTDLMSALGQLDETDFQVTGRCIDPALLPAEIEPGQLARCELTEGEQTRNYTFKLLPSVQSPYYSPGLLGQAIRGHLSRTAVWGNEG